MESFAPENNSVKQWFRHKIDYGIIGVSLSEPHIDELEFVYIYISYVVP